MSGLVGVQTMHKDSGLAKGKHHGDRDARPGHRTGDRTEDAYDAARPPGDTLWDIGDVAAYLRIPISSIYKMTARRAAVCIPHIRIGGKLRFRRADVDHWLSLLSTSKSEALSKMRQKVSQVTHGNHP